MSFRHSPRRSAVALLVALLVAGCGSVAPTTAPTAAPTVATASPTAGAESPRPPAEVYAEVRAAVEAIRGLSPTSAVEPVVIDEAQLRTNLEAEFDATRTPSQLEDGEDLLIALGLLPPGASLRQVTLDFQAGQVAGYYSPEKDALFVVRRSGGPGPVDEVTYAHEFTHQLQDQRIDLEALGIDVVDQSDRSLARLALVEGDATSVQTSWMAANLDARELGEVLAAGLDPKALEALQKAPAYLRETALFPYQDGFAFVSRFLAGGGYAAVDAVYADPPDSTEQILHPDKYATREPPIEVALPQGLAAGLGADWALAAEDTLGELLLRVWLVEGGVPLAEARIAAAGWGGDRVALLRGPDGELAMQLRTEWDTPADADQFAASAQTAAATLPLGGLVDHADGSRTVVVSIGGYRADGQPAT